MRLPARLTRVHARSQVLLGLHLQMELQFFLCLGVLAPAVEDTAASLDEVGEQTHFVPPAQFSTAVDRVHGPLPLRTLHRDLPPSDAGEKVVARPAVVLRDPPLGLHPALALHTLEGRIQRSLLDREHVPRHGLDPLGQPPAVHRLEGEGAQHQQLQGALHDVGIARRSSDLLLSR